MIKRRKFLKIGGASAALLAMGSNPINATAKKKKARKKVKKKVARKSVSQLFLSEVIGNEPAGSPGLGAIGGWGVPVITIGRQLIAMVHLNNVEQSRSYDINARINGEALEEDTGVIDTDSNGDGETLMVINLTGYPRSIGTMNVQFEAQGDNGDLYASANVPISQPRTRKKKKKKAT